MCVVLIADGKWHKCIFIDKGRFCLFKNTKIIREEYTCVYRDTCNVYEYVQILTYDIFLKKLY